MFPDPNLFSSRITFWEEPPFRHRACSYSVTVANSLGGRNELIFHSRHPSSGFDDGQMPGAMR